MSCLLFSSRSPEHTRRRPPGELLTSVRYNRLPTSSARLDGRSSAHYETERCRTGQSNTLSSESTDDHAHHRLTTSPTHSDNLYSCHHDISTYQEDHAYFDIDTPLCQITPSHDQEDNNQHCDLNDPSPSCQSDPAHRHRATPISTPSDSAWRVRSFLEGAEPRMAQHCCLRSVLTLLHVTLALTCGFYTVYSVVGEGYNLDCVPPLVDHFGDSVPFVSLYSVFHHLWTILMTLCLL